MRYFAVMNPTTARYELQTKDVYIPQGPAGKTEIRLKTDDFVPSHSPAPRKLSFWGGSVNNLFGRDKRGGLQGAFEIYPTIRD